MVYRSINMEAPNYFTALFDKLSGVREPQNTNTDLKLPRLKNSSGQRCFAYRGAQLWNNLSTEVKTASSMSRFTATYKNNNFFTFIVLFTSAYIVACKSLFMTRNIKFIVFTLTGQFGNQSIFSCS